MPVKYSCPKCGRRFAEWGAEKFGFKCPGDEWCPADRPEEIELVRVGMQEDAKPAKKPTLKRPTKRVVATPSSMNEDELLVPDIEDIEADTVVDADDADDVEDDDDETVEVSDDVVVDGADDTVVDLDDAVVDSDDEDGVVDVDDSLEDAEDIIEDDVKA